MEKLPAAAQDNVDTKGLLSGKVSCLASHTLTGVQAGKEHTHARTCMFTHTRAHTHTHKKGSYNTQINRLIDPLRTVHHSTSS